MRLEFAILADAAVVTSDGKFSVLNGDLGAIFVPSFPATQSVLALVAKVSIHQDEKKTQHLFRAELLGPDGTQLIVPAQGTMQFQPSSYDSELLTAGMVVNLALITFPIPGKYLFHIFVDDREVGVTPLYLGLSETEATILPQKEVVSENEEEAD